MTITFTIPLFSPAIERRRNYRRQAILPRGYDSRVGISRSVTQSLSQSVILFSDLSMDTRTPGQRNSVPVVIRADTNEWQMNGARRHDEKLITAHHIVVREAFRGCNKGLPLWFP